MTMLRNIYRMISVTALLALVFLVSCSKVKFADSVEHVGDNMSKESFVKFEIDWSSVTGEIPEEMTVLMSRIQNVTVHYAWRVDSSGKVINHVAQRPDTPLAAASETTPSDGTTPDGTEPEVPETPSAPDPSLLVKNGVYAMMAVAACDPEDYIIPDVDVYEDSIAYRLQDIYVEVPKVPDSVRFKQNLIDLNPMCPFIRATKPFYFVRSDNNALVSSVREDEDRHVPIPLAPQELTHNIGFKVFLKTEDPSRAEGAVEEVQDSIVGVVYLDTLKAVISGIPPRVQLMSGYMSDQNLGKMGFNLKKVDETRVTDTPAELTLYEGTYAGSIDAFGLFPATSMDYLAGPGILNVFLYPKVYYENDFGKKIALSRVFHASLNIKNEIDEAKIMVKAQDRDLYYYGKDGDMELVIRTNIELSYDDVMSGSSQGLKEWTNNELYPDGFNPGLEM